ncbi:MAG: hypothetical protein H6765_09220 [Candidatus Peribacteria bacterium]|nr:MAG: hypothetical protein H6765_09220 [Candidatus Peribacteria bacterium]
MAAAKSSTSRIYDEQLQAMQHALQQAEQEISIAEVTAAGKDSNTRDSLQILEQQKSAAQTTAQNLEQVFATKERSIISNTQDALNQAYLVTTDVLEFSDRFLGVSSLNKDANDAFESKISAKDTSLGRKAVDQWRQLSLEKQELANKFDRIKQLLQSLDLINGDDKSEILSLLDASITYMQDLDSFLQLMQQVLDHTISGQTISEQQIAQYSQTVNNYQAQVTSTLLVAQRDMLL